MIIGRKIKVYEGGHNMGQFFSSPCDRFAYVPIPKCASSWTTKFLQAVSWSVSKDTDDILSTSYTTLVVLRDPIERWISGLAQYLTTYHPKLPLQSREFIQFIFQRIDFDPHTTPQINFITGLETDNIVFFKFDQNLEKNIKTFIKENTGASYEEPIFRNDSPHTGYKPFANQKLKMLLESNDDYRNNVIKYYEQDINFYNTVRFYGV